MNTPNFFIVGAAKSGTTSLYNYLKQHEDVFMSPIKEPQYFGDDIHGESFGKFDALSYFKTSPLPEMHIANVNNWEDYQKLFAEGQERKAIGEASTAYLFSKSAAREIKSKIPQAKIIIILRNPIERAYSHYLMNIQGGISKQSFIDAINEDYEKKEKGWGVSNLYIEIGQYFQQIQRYFHEFPKDQIKILLFEDLINDQATLMEDIYSFLEIDKNYNADYSKQHLVSQSPRFNNSIYFLNKLGLKKVKNIMPEGVMPVISKILFNDKKPKITSQEREHLKQFYQEDIDKLSGLIEKDLSLWKI